MAENRSNEEWLADLKANGPAQEAAIADLRELLLRAAVYFFSRSSGDQQRLSREETLQRAEDCAQDALIAVMSHLQDFRGDSKFSTWAYKFAINLALMAARQERWKQVSLDQLSTPAEKAFSEWVMQDPSGGAAPERSALQAELQAVIRTIIAQELTERQRQVLVWMVFQEVPMDEVVRHLGSNRNSVYKLLHDARRKLKSGLQARGFEVSETLALFQAMKQDSYWLCNSYMRSSE